MLSGLMRSAMLAAKARTGASTQLLVCAAIAIIGAIATFGFLCVLAFIWLSDQLTPLEAASVIAGFFFAVTLLSIITLAILRRRTMNRARILLAAQQSALMLDPKVVGIGVQLGRIVGWKKVLPIIIPIAIAGVLAVNMGRSWSRADE
jgi:uncharacterized membrane protein